MVLPAGIEPASPPSEGDILSIERRERSEVFGANVYICAEVPNELPYADIREQWGHNSTHYFIEASSAWGSRSLRGVMTRRMIPITVALTPSVLKTV